MDDENENSEPRRRVVRVGGLEHVKVFLNETMGEGGSIRCLRTVVGENKMQANSIKKNFKNTCLPTAAVNNLEVDEIDTSDLVP